MKKLSMHKYLTMKIITPFAAMSNLIVLTVFYNRNASLHEPIPQDPLLPWSWVADYECKARLHLSLIRTLLFLSCNVLSTQFYFYIFIHARDTQYSIINFGNVVYNSNASLQKFIRKPEN